MQRKNNTRKYDYKILFYAKRKINSRSNILQNPVKEKILTNIFSECIILTITDQKDARKYI